MSQICFCVPRITTPGPQLLAAAAGNRLWAHSRVCILRALWQLVVVLGQIIQIGCAGLFAGCGLSRVLLVWAVYLAGSCVVAVLDWTAHVLGGASARKCTRSPDDDDDARWCDDYRTNTNQISAWQKRRSPPWNSKTKSGESSNLLF